MSFLHDMPIGKKLATLLLLFIVGLCAYIGFVFQTAHAVRANTGFARNAYPLLLQVGDSSRLTTAMRDLYTVAVTSQDSDMLESAREQAREVQAQTARLVASAAANGVTIAELPAAFEAYYKAADAWASTMVAGNSAPGLAQSRLYELAQRQQEFHQQLDRSRLAINTAFEARLQNIEADADRTWQFGLFGGVALSLLMLGLNSVVTRRMIVRPLQSALAATGRIAEGNWDEAVPAGSRDELGQLLQGMETLRQQLRARREEDKQTDFIEDLLKELTAQMHGDLTVAELCERVIRFLAPGLGCEIGLVYVRYGKLLQPTAAYALRLDDIEAVPKGESLVGQVAQTGQGTVLREVPAGYARKIVLGSGAMPPRTVAILPVHHQDELLAVLELGALNAFDDEFMAIVARCSELFASTLKVAQSRMRLAEIAARAASSKTPDPAPDLAL